MAFCDWIGHIGCWEMQAFGWKYDPNWKGGEGPPPIRSSWRGKCRICGKHKTETVYSTPASVKGFVQGALGR